MPLILVLLLSLAASTAPVVMSPNGQIAVLMETSGSGVLQYQVHYKGKPLIAASRLGIDTAGQPPLGDRVKIAAVRTGELQETYSMPHGKTNPLVNRANTAEVMIEETAGPLRHLTIDVRAWDDGVAFRYRVPAQPSLRELKLEKELTEFHLAAEGRSYPLLLQNYRTSYEDSYVALPLTSIKQGALVALPFLAEVPGAGWVGVTEAHLENYAGMYLKRANGRVMEAALAPLPDEPGILVNRSTPMETPWRVILIGPTPGALVESDIVLHCNPPSRIQDTSWIKPGKTSWSWWSGDLAKNVPFKPAMNTETMKHYIDFSAEAGLEYALIDEGWSATVNGRSRDLTRTNPALDLPAILAHARQKNVGVWLWAHWTFVDMQMEEAFPLFEKWGVRGVKIDFMDSDDQRMVGFYHRSAALAARHKLMVDFHGAFKPTGLRKYYPNVLTHEAVLGLEYLKWSARATATHNTIIPFTRMLAGPLDYTPGGFSNVVWDEFRPRFVEPLVPTTRAHQLALYVVFESAFQMLADYPENYRGTKELAFLKAVPVTWNETRVLSGMPGESIVIARRKGREWFIGAITNENPRAISIPLSFLPAGAYSVEKYEDGPTPSSASVSTAAVTPASTLQANLAPSGGAAFILRPR
ncbi:MAG: glycoside hydrolase family 97 protein [Bryobacteraceae bacterium]|nr:glycoside hydrolase family 97 protein [Bryobacteraceae bacterium]